MSSDSSQGPDKKSDDDFFGPNFMSDDIPIFQEKEEEDQEWKQKLQGESQKIDEKYQQEKAEKSQNKTDPNFMRLVSVFASQAYIFSGAVDNPATGGRTPNLEQAQESIDSLVALKEKSKGNLSEEEDKVLSQLISELQMIFVQLKNASSAPPPPGQAEKPAG